MAAKLLITTTPLNAGRFAKVWATRQLSPGRHRPRQSDWRLLATGQVGVSLPSNFITQYRARFGRLIAGQVIFIRYELMAVNRSRVDVGLVVRSVVAP